MKIRKAVIPAAGLGTRVLPATKAIPKEMFPIVDKPAIQYIVEEAAKSGIEDILIITSRGKSEMEDHFDRMPELESKLIAGGESKRLMLEQVVDVTKLANITYVRQMEQKGLGPVSYTHLDVYKRQAVCFAYGLCNRVIGKAFRHSCILQKLTFRNFFRMNSSHFKNCLLYSSRCV